MKKVESLPEGLKKVSTSNGSAGFYLQQGLPFSGPGIYEDDQFFVVVSKNGKIDRKEKKDKNIIGREEKLEHPSLEYYYGNQFFAEWYLKND